MTADNYPAYLPLGAELPRCEFTASSRRVPLSRCTFLFVEVSTVPSPLPLDIRRTPSTPYTPFVLAGSGPAEFDSPSDVPSGFALGYGLVLADGLVRGVGVASGRAPRLPDILGLVGVLLGVPGVVARPGSEP